MKKIFCLLLVAAICLPISSVLVNAETSAPRVMTDTVTVIAEGNLGTDYANVLVSVLVMREGASPDSLPLDYNDVFYLNQTQAREDGYYGFKFTCAKLDFDNGVSNGRIYIKVGNEDKTDTLIKAEAEVYKLCTFDLSVISNMGAKTAKLSVANPFNKTGEVNFAFCKYAENNSIIDVKRQNVIFKNEDESFTVTFDYTGDAAYMKAFAWTHEMIPLTKIAVPSEEIKPLKVLMIGNSYSIDTHRYVNQIAASMGINIDFHVYQIGGHSVYSLYNKREIAGQWLYALNGVGTALPESTLGAFLDVNSDFDAVILQNFWGDSKGMLYYDKDEAVSKEDNSSYTNFSSPYYTDFAKYIKEKLPDTEIMINAVWSLEMGHDTLLLDFLSDYSQKGYDTAQEYMFGLFDSHNRLAAAEIGAAVLPSGQTIGRNAEAVLQIPTGYGIQFARQWVNPETGDKTFYTTHPKELFNALQNGDPIPYAPEDLAAGRIRLNRDGFHLSQEGRYLASCITFEVLTGKSAMGSTFRPGTEFINVGVVNETGGTTETVAVRLSGISEEIGELLQGLAHEAVELFYTENSHNVKGGN